MIAGMLTQLTAAAEEIAPAVGRAWSPVTTAG